MRNNADPGSFRSMPENAIYRQNLSRTDKKDNTSRQTEFNNSQLNGLKTVRRSATVMDR